MAAAVVQSSPSLGSGLDESIFGVDDGFSHKPAPPPRTQRIDFQGRSGHRCYQIAAVICCLIAMGCVVALSVVLALSDTNDQSSSQASLPSHWFRMLALSDVHLDILYRPRASAFSQQPCHDDTVLAAFGESATYGKVGCDSPLPLFDTALQAMLEVDESTRADVVLVTGDKAGHNLYNKADGSSYHGVLALQAQKQFAEGMAKSFPNRRTVLTMGNNDVRYHWQIPTSSWYESLWQYWAPLILCRSCTPGRYPSSISEVEFNRTFLRGGFYKIQVSSGLRLLVVNSLYWTSFAWTSTKPFRSEIPIIAEEQMQWMASELANASSEGNKVVVVGHVPPGLDPFRPDATNVSLVRQFWFDNYTRQFLQTVGETYRDTVVCTFFAHLHKDDFRLLSYDDSDATRVPTLLFSSVSPIYENNPSFRMLYFNPAGWYLADYTQYWTDLVLDNTKRISALWNKLYTFSEVYPGAQRIDATRLQALWKSVMNVNSSTVWHTYMNHRQVYFANTLNSYSRDHLYCVAYSANLSSYAGCRQQHPYEPKS